MKEWTDIVTSPLGIVGYVLCLIFGFLGQAKRGDKRRWMAPAAFILAAVALIGGLGLAWAQLRENATAVKVTQKTPAQVQTPPPAPAQTLNCQPASQTSAETTTPVDVNCVQGPVTITIDQSSGKKTGKEDHKKPQQEKKDNDK